MMSQLEQFSNDLIKKKIKPTTITNYVIDIKQLIEWLDEKELNQDNLETFKQELKKEYKPATVNRKIVSINKFLKSIGTNVIIKQDKIQEKQYLNNVITNREFSMILDDAKEQKDYRALALFATLGYTGARISEALQLTVDDVDQETILIEGKGNKHRELFLPDVLRVILMEYVADRKNHSHTPNKALFIGQRGKMTPASADQLLKKYCDKLGIDEKKAHCHAFRHMYGKNTAERFGIEVTAELLGHSDLKVTRQYTKRSKQEMMNMINSL